MRARPLRRHPPIRAVGVDSRGSAAVDAALAVVALSPFNIGGWSKAGSQALRHNAANRIISVFMANLLEWVGRFRPRASCAEQALFVRLPPVIFAKCVRIDRD